MDDSYDKAYRKMQVKLKCEKYLKTVVDNFIAHNGESYCFQRITKNIKHRRKLRFSKGLEKSLKDRNIPVHNFMEHMMRPAIHTMLQHWLTTLPAYRDDSDYSGGEICNIFLWSEMSGTYGYIIWQFESYVWRVSPERVQDMITYFKLNNRYFECKQIGNSEICKAWLKFKPVNANELPKVMADPHFETVQLPALIANAKTSGEVMLNIAEHLIAKSLDDTGEYIPDVEYKSERHKELNVMMRPKPHII